MKAVNYPLVHDIEHGLTTEQIQERLQEVVRGGDRLIHHRRVMDILGCQKTKCYELMNSGDLGPIFKVGASRRVLESAVTEYLAGGTQDPTA